MVLVLTHTALTAMSGFMKKELKPNFFQHHSDRFIEAALRSDRHEIVYQADGYGECQIDCGDVLKIYLMIADETVQTVSYTTNGCLNTNACANAVIELALGRTLTDAWRINEADLIDYLETLPPEHNHCAALAVGALRHALANASDLQRTPWKKHYR